MKRICLHGATGSIGTQTVDVICAHPEAFKLVAMSFGSNVEKAFEIAEKCRPQYIVAATAQGAQLLKSKLTYKATVDFGEENIAHLSKLAVVDMVLNGIMGSSGLKATIAAIESKKEVAIANKEPLVMAGHIVMAKARENGVQILPVDSEHSAIFQCLEGNEKEVKKLILTASGGSFRDMSRDQMWVATRGDALKHPNWAMGEKITIDSATLVNKGLEVIEAHHLFQVDYDKIDVVMHKESIVHSMVEYIDRSIIAHLGSSDMRIPIQYALTYPKRFDYHAESLNLCQVGTLHFSEIRHSDFPLLKTAFEVGKSGGAAPIIYNAANEAAVKRFLNSEIGFLDIERLILEALETTDVHQDVSTIEAVFNLHMEVYEKAQKD